MVRRILFIILGLIIICSAAGAVPQYINYQGILRDSNGDAQTGTFSMTFKIYAAETGGTAVYDSGATSVSVSNGLYNVQLGTVDSTVFTGADRWLEVTVAGDTLSPRLKINSVAYAITASNVEDDAITSAKILDGTIAGGDLAGGIDITTTGDVSVGGLTTSGTLNISGVVGTGTIVVNDGAATVTNTNLTANSIILLSVGHAAATANFVESNGGIRVSGINVGANQFTVSTMNGSGPDGNLPFSYIIIN
ncbi:hypothetical protein ACFL52_02090 [Candidatus Margulisiibacteriota bacterium]